MNNGLYIVSTPIGNLNDISSRASNSLKNADLIICENPNHSNKLLLKLGIKKKLLSLHDHNEQKIINKIKNKLENQAIVLISDAGSPLISDPGYKLVKYCIENNFFVTSVPGPTSIIPALQLSSMPIDKFQFLGFAPKAKKGLKDFILQIKDSEITSVFFSSSHRIIDCLNQISNILPDKKIAVCKEITKINEKKFIGNSLEVIKQIENRVHL